MSDNEIEDVSFLPGPGQGGTGKRAVYEPSGSQRCKQIICSKNYAILIVSLFVCLVLAIALIASFARPGDRPCMVGETQDSETVAPTEATATTGEKFPWEKIRLPDMIIPLSYNIHMHPNLSSFHFSGVVNITIQVKETTDFVVFHSKKLNITSHSLLLLQDVDDLAVEQYDVKSFLENVKHEQIYMELERPLIKGKRYLLNLKFEGILSQLLTGFYRSSYKNPAGQTRWLATTHFEPTDARAAFPCFDEPALKASFQMSMVRDKGYISLFNMPKESTWEYPNGLEVDHFQSSVKMSTYLVAFVVCDYASLHNTTGKGTNVSVYAPPHLIEQGRFALLSATICLEYYETFFSASYPLPKQDLIAIPDFAAGAMENWGLITYRMTAILYDKEESSASNQQQVAVVVAHELAHQWFGNLVTMKWWNDLWLNEGFATYVEFIGTNIIQPEWKMMDQLLVENMQGALSEDSLSSSHPISVPVQDPAQINEIFDAISYGKGASVIRMLQGFIGQAAIQEGLSHYLQKFAFGNAETDDLWEALSKVTKDIDVKTVMDTWTLQMGYPVITLSWDGHQLHAEQERFLLNPGNTAKEEFVSPYGYKWEVPLTYITNLSPETSSAIFWMHKDSISFNLDPGFRWIKANVNQTGFYRVHYSEENWRALKDQLLKDHTVFTSADRAGLLDDAFALARSGKLKAELALELSTYLKKEKEYVPWYVGLVNLAYIGILLEEQDTYKYFADYEKDLMSYWIENIGWVDTGPHLDKFLRGLILGMAVKLNHEGAIIQARRYFTDWMENKKRVPPNLKNIVYRAGVQYGGNKEWDYCWQQYKETQIPSEKQKLLVALATTTDAARLNRYLHMSLQDDKVRKQDTGSVVSHIGASSAAGRVLAWRFFKKNFATFASRYGHGSFEMSRLVQRVAGDFNSQYDYDEVEEFFKTHHAGSGQRAVAQSLESIRMNINWLARNEKEVTAWLKKQTTSGTDTS